MSVVALLCLLLLMAAPLRAQPQRVALSARCASDAWNQAELLQGVTLELQSDGVLDVAAQAPSAWLTVECEPGASRVTLITRSTTQPQQMRALSLADVPPELQVRTIAIALAELLRGSARPDLPPLAAESPPPGRSAERQAQPARETDRPTSVQRAGITLSVAPVLRLYGPASTLLYGGSLGLQALDFELAGQVLLAQRFDPLGTLHYGTASFSLAYDLLRLRAGRLALVGGPRIALGLAWGGADALALGAPPTESTLDLIWDIAARLSPRLSLDTRWSLALTLAAGYARGPHYAADRRTVASLQGAFGDASLALAHAF